MSDIFNHRGYKWKCSSVNILNDNNCKGTILREYLDRMPRKNLANLCPLNFRLKMLNDVIYDKSSKYEIPKLNELVVHIRSGDTGGKYFTNFNCISTNIKPNIIKVTIVTALHSPTKLNKPLIDKNMLIFRNLIQRLLIKFPNVEFDIKSSTDVDEDIVYMVNAHHFIKSGRGFSELIKNIRMFRHKNC